jgi:hypothetical protein
MTFSIPSRAALAGGLCALALGACGSGDDKAPAKPSGGGASSGGASPRGAIQNAGLKFAGCMRKQGVDMPDPKQAANGLTMIEPPEDADPATLKRAQKACQKHLDSGLPAPSAGDKEQAGKGALRFARCMREHGIDMPDPTGEGIAIGPDSGIDPQDPAFQGAQKACGKLLSGGTF